MATLLSRIFGRKKQKTEAFIEKKMRELLKKSGIKLSFDLKVSEDNKEILVDLFGEDEHLVKDQEIHLLDALQVFLKKATHNQWPEEKVGIIVDCDSYRAQYENDLIDQAEKLKSLVLKKRKTLYFRALPPRERKIIHQVFSGDKRIHTKSIGDGLFKKIRISLVGGKSGSSKTYNSRSENSNFRREGFDKSHKKSEEEDTKDFNNAQSNNAQSNNTQSNNTQSIDKE